jgi:hypothetical protein
MPDIMTPHPTAIKMLHKFGNPARLQRILSPRDDIVIGIFKSNHHIAKYDVVTAFLVFGMWHASMDRHNASSEDTIKAIAERTNT